MKDEFVYLCSKFRVDGSDGVPESGPVEMGEDHEPEFVGEVVLV